MRITRIELQNFRAFYGTYAIELGNGKNLLVYGENGSGKSSLYTALQEFLFGQDRLLQPQRNIFADDNAEAHIKLSVRDSTVKNAVPAVVAWSDKGNGDGNLRTTVNQTDQPVIRQAALTSGFLEYKGLLETYFLHIQDDNRINIFNLLVERLLYHIADARSGKTLQEDWRHIQALLHIRHGSQVKREYKVLLRFFNVRLARMLKDLEATTEQILKRFGYRVDLRFKFEGVDIDYAPNKRLVGDSIYFDVKYFDRPIERHHAFLNEAKLSALALAIYFAALLQTPHDKAKLNLLVLDDVLIGLDMSNRLPMLEILRDFFKDYQIFFLTYDRIWYEMVKTQLTVSDWKKIELYCGSEPTLDIEMPIYADNISYVETARNYFEAHDYRGAVMYLRTAFETMLKDFCDKRGCPVPYREDQRYEAKPLWDAVKAAKNDDRIRFIELALEKEIEFNLRYFLNTLSHANVINVVRAEVEKVLHTIEKLEKILQAAPKKQRS